MPSVSFDWPLEGIKIVTPGVYLVSLEVSAQVMFIQWNPTYSVRAGITNTAESAVVDSWVAPLVPASAQSASWWGQLNSGTVGVNAYGGTAVIGTARGTVIATRPYVFAAGDLLVPFAEVVCDASLAPVLQVLHFGAIHLPTAAVPTTLNPVISEAALLPNPEADTSGSGLTAIDETQVGCSIYVSDTAGGPGLNPFIMTGLWCILDTVATGTVDFYTTAVPTSGDPPSDYIPPWTHVATVAVVAGIAKWTGAAAFLNAQEASTGVIYDGDLITPGQMVWITALYSGDAHHPPIYAIPAAFMCAVGS